MLPLSPQWPSVAGVSTTDANDRALPCEVMLKDLSGRLATATVPAGTMTQISGLQAKALERCNADDDARADAFAAQALALVPASLDLSCKEFYDDRPSDI